MQTNNRSCSFSQKLSTITFINSVFIHTQTKLNDPPKGLVEGRKITQIVLVRTNWTFQQMTSFPFLGPSDLLPESSLFANSQVQGQHHLCICSGCCAGWSTIELALAIVLRTLVLPHRPWWTDHPLARRESTFHHHTWLIDPNDTSSPVTDSPWCGRDCVVRESLESTNRIIMAYGTGHINAEKSYPVFLMQYAVVNCDSHTIKLHPKNSYR